MNFMMNNRRSITTIKIIQHNVLKWTLNRRNELTNLYMKEDPDILLLNATGVKQDQTIKIFNYNVYQRNVENENHAGIAIAVKRNLQHQVIDDFEDDVLAVKIETRKGPVVVATAYRPPRREFMSIEDLLTLFRMKDPVYFLADINARHRFIGHNDNNNIGKIIDSMITKNMVSYLGPEFNTRIAGNGISRPDIILRNMKGFYNYSIREGEVTTSDHLPIIFKIATTAIIKECPPRRQYKRTDWTRTKEKINQDMEELNITRNLSNNPRNVDKEIIDQEIKKWTESIIQRVNEETPVKKMIYVPHPKESDLLKLLQEIYNQIKNKDVYSQEDRRMLQRVQEEIKTENIRIFEENWEDLIKKIDLHKNDPKIFWENIRRLMGGKDNGPPSYILDKNNVKIYKTEDKLKIFKETWEEEIFQITEVENREFDMENERRVEEYLVQNEYRTRPYPVANLNRLDGNNSLTRPVTIFDIIKIIANFKNKAPGESGITKNMLVNAPRSALERLKEIVNLLLSMGYFSIEYKNGHMVMAPKPDKDKRKVLNYRPITLLEVPAKILERIINDRFYEYLEENNILNANQFGFRRNLGTELAILKLYEIIAMNQRQRSQCNVVCRDVAKAFDKVWHRGLKFKILRLQLPDITEKILCSFLDNRTAQIKMEGRLSDKFELKSGVPQGSILSPTMYIFYTSDLRPPGPGATDIMFADDVSQVIEYPHSSKRMLALKTEREIERINRFEKQWKIRTNKNKFKILSISKAKPAEIRIENRIIPFSNRINILGFELRRTGFGAHIRSRIAIARGRVTKLKRFIKLQAKTKNRLYKSLIRSQLEYPNMPQCVMAASKKSQLQSFQNGTIRRFIHRQQRDQQIDIEELHQEYNIEPVNKRMFRRAKKTWEKFTTKEPELAEATMEMNQQRDTNDHYWWQRVAPYIASGEPAPEYG